MRTNLAGFGHGLKCDSFLIVPHDLSLLKIDTVLVFVRRAFLQVQTQRSLVLLVYQFYTIQQRRKR